MTRTGVAVRQLDRNKQLGARLSVEGASFVVRGDFNSETPAVQDLGMAHARNLSLVSSGLA